MNLKDLEKQITSSHDSRSAKSKLHPARFKLFSIEEVLNEPSPDWRVEGLLPEGALSMIYAPQANYKTFFCLDVALSVAHGLPFHGRRVKAGPAVYVLGEGRGGLKNRIRAWLHAHAMRMGENAFFVLEAVQFHRPKDVEALRSQIDSLNVKPAMLFIDTFARNAVGIDENNATEVGQWIDAVTALKHAIETDVVAVHHAQKNSDNGRRARERGSSAFIGAVDTVIRLERKSTTRRTVIISCEKQKDAEEFREFRLRAKSVLLGPNEHGHEASSCVLEADDAEIEKGLSVDHRRVLEILSHSRDHTAQRADLIKASGIAERTFDRYREELEEENLLETVKRGVFKITEAGVAAIANELPRCFDGDPIEDVAATSPPLSIRGGWRQMVTTESDERCGK